MHTPEVNPNDWGGRLRALSGGRLVVVGIGRAESGDDGVGPLVVRLLSGRTEAKLIDAGSAPENFVGPIVREKPEVVLFVDAVHFGGEIGEVCLVEPSRLDNSDFTTHAMSPQLLLEYISQETGARTLVVGIQPGASGFNRPMSEAVREAARRVADVLAGAD